MLATKWGINILMSQTAITAEVMKKVCQVIAKVLQTDLIPKVGFSLSLFLAFFLTKCIVLICPGAGCTNEIARIHQILDSFQPFKKIRRGSVDAKAY